MRILFFSAFTFLASMSLRAQDSLFTVATTFFDQAQYENALKAFRQAGEQFREANRFEEYATCNLEMAQCHTRMAAYASSMDYASNVLDYVIEVLPDNEFLKAEAQRVIGEDLLHLGQSEQALEHLKLAEGYYPKTSLNGRDECYNLLALAYANTGNENLALEYHQQALALRIARLGDQSLEVANSYNNMGLLYIYSDPDQATTYFERVLPIYEAEYGESHPRVAFVMINLAQAKSEQKKYFDAIGMISQALDIWEEILPLDHPNKAFTHSVYGRILESQGNYDEALHQQEIALQMYVKLFGEKHPDVANVHLLIGEIYQRKERYTASLTSYQRAIYANLPNQTFQDSYDRPRIDRYLNADYLLSALVAKANALEALHFGKTLKASDLTEAIAHYAIADTLLSDIRRIRLKESDKIKLGSMAQTIYENGIRISLILADQPLSKKKYHEVAFQFLERSKASVLLGAIQDTKAKSFAGIPADLLRIEDSLKLRIIGYQELISRGENIQENQDKLFVVQQQYFELIDEFESTYPRYYELKYARDQIRLEDIQGQLGPHEALLIFMQGTENLYRFTLTQTNTRITAIPSSETLRHDLSGFRNGLKYNLAEGYLQSGRDLHATLIPKLPKRINSLIILPDGRLNSIPFEALIDPSTNRYLVESYAVSYDFATSLLLQRSTTDASQANNALLVAPIQFPGSNLVELPATGKEVSDIRYLFKSANIEATIRREDEASEAYIKEADLSDFTYLHFATHGLVNESKPELSRVFLSGDPTHDGSLYAGDIYALEIHADLVALSACETGLGKIEKGEGVLGLSRALLFAGARNLLVSQWQVSDASTAELMLEFYHQHLLNSQRVPFRKALRQAKLTMINSDNYKAPYYWAPFILVGQ